MAREYVRETVITSSMKVSDEFLNEVTLKEWLDYDITGRGTDYEAIWAPCEGPAGNGKLVLVTRKTTPSSGDYARIAFPSIGRFAKVVEFRAWVAGAAEAASDIVEGFLEIMDGTDRYLLGIRISAVDAEVSAVNATGGWTVLGDFNGSLDVHSWIELYAKANLSTLEYQLVRVQNREWTPTFNLFKDAGNGVDNLNQLIFRVQTAAAARRAGALGYIAGRAV